MGWDGIKQMNIKPEYHARNFPSHAVYLVSTIISPKQPHCWNSLKLHTEAACNGLEEQNRPLPFPALAGFYHGA